MEHPRNIENFLQSGEEILLVSKCRGVEEWESDHLETFHEEDKSTTYPIHREGTTFYSETLVFTPHYGAL